MITAGYCVTMARYNAWQNSQLRGCLTGLAPEEIGRDRGAFFGSILATLNHLVWADAAWMSRIDGGKNLGVGMDESFDLFPGLEPWAAAREEMDARITQWADGVSDAVLSGPLVYHSGILGRDLNKPMALCVVHMFNHQTHHRGQIHAMLTATGSRAPVSDLVFMPEQE